jgi:hypothetical protein
LARRGLQLAQPPTHPPRLAAFGPRGFRGRRTNDYRDGKGPAHGPRRPN